MLTLGVTPVLAAMLDDPYCLRELHTWAGGWQLRAVEAGAASCRSWPGTSSGAATDVPGRPGGPLADRRAVGGAAAAGRRRRGRAARRPGHAPVPAAAGAAGRGRRARGRAGRHQAAARPGAGRDLGAGVRARPRPGGPVRGGRASSGSWSTPPRCTATPPRPGRSAPARVLCFGRDLEVTYRVWSPRAGYPGAPDYRDFHTFDHASGFRPARVTGRHVPPEREAAVGAGPGRGGGTPGRGRLRRHRAGPAAGCSPTGTGGRAWSWPRSTPSCSGTGGTRGRPGWRPCCGRCRRRACG